jgi:hypothetical protein
MKKEKKQKKPLMFRFIKWLIGVFFRKKKLIGLENLGDEPCIVVGNHAQAFGPLFGELHFPTPVKIWCVDKMLNKKEAGAYAFEDFWSGKPKSTRWFFKLLSPLLGRILYFAMSNAECIPVYRDMRALNTYKLTVQALEQEKNVLIFPEGREKYNDIVNKFQERYVEVAKIYCKRTGKALSFVPMYYAVSLKTVVFGKPIQFSLDKSVEEQMSEISKYLMEEITKMAKELPRHKVVPYENLSKRQYKWSKEKE